MENVEVLEQETEETTAEWVDKVLNNPDSSEEEKAEALALVKKVESALDDFTDRWLAIQEIEDEDERERLIAEWEAEEE
jgi:hypothetical protein